METSESEIKYEKMNQLCIYYRGVIIHKIIELEWAIEVLITNYYCTDERKASEMFHSVVARYKLGLSFDSKTAILAYIVHGCPEFSNKSGYLKEIGEMQNIRNIVAHRKIVCTDKAIKDFDGDTLYIQWVTTGKGKLEPLNESFNRAKINKWGNQIDELTGRTQELMKLLNLKGKV